MSLATINGSPVARCRAQIPAWGRWWIDVDVQDELALSAGDAATIVIADKTLVGSVVSGGSVHGRSSYRVVAGSGGWSTSVAARAYRDSGGVPYASIVSDAATEVGETIAAVPSSRGSEHYARSAGPASRVLHELFPRTWYVDFAGVTQFSLRPSAAYETGATRTDQSRRQDWIDLAVDEIGSLEPGVVVDARESATDVEYRLDERRLTVRVYAGPRSSRDLDAFRRLLDAADPRREYRCAYEYRVVTQSGDALDLQPVRASAGMPDLESVPVRLSPGVRADHFLGSLVTVIFLDADPSRPRVISGDDDGAPGWMPLFLELGDAPTLGVARVTDPVIAGPWPGTIVSGSVRVKAGL